MFHSIYSYLILSVLVFFAAAGAPLPVSGALTAAGVLAATNRMDIALLFALTSLGAVAGDLLGYAAGRFGIRWFARQSAVRAGWLSRAYAKVTGTHSVKKAIGWSNGMLKRRGGMGMLLLLSRTVLAAFGPVVNVVSGVRHFPLRAFILYDILGELIWAGTYIGVGFAAGLQGENAVDILTNPAVIAIMVGLAVIPMLVTAMIKPQPAAQPVRVEARAYGD